MAGLQEIDSVEITVIIDNEVDPLSVYTNEGLEVSGRLQDIAMTSKFPAPNRGEAKAEMRMEQLCCGAHGLSYLIVSNLSPNPGARGSSDLATDAQELMGFPRQRSLVMSGARCCLILAQRNGRGR
jgi:hypothetical protein